MTTMSIMFSHTYCVKRSWASLHLFKSIWTRILSSYFLPRLLFVLTIGQGSESITCLVFSPSCFEHIAHLGSFVHSFITCSMLSHLLHRSLPGHTTVHLAAVCLSIWHLNHLCTSGRSLREAIVRPILNLFDTSPLGTAFVRSQHRHLCSSWRHL